MSDSIQDEEMSVSVDINRTRLIKFGILIGTVLVLLGLLFLFTFLSRSSWSSGLSSEIGKVLSDNGIECTVGKMDDVRSGVSANLVSFSLDGDPRHAVMVRIPTLYGPIPGVFIYSSETSSARFIGFYGVKGMAEDAILSAARESQVSYWERKIPKVMENVTGLSAAKEESR